MSMSATANRTLERYFTGYLTSDWAFHRPLPPYRGRGWYITLEGTERCKGSGTYDGVAYAAKEVVINSRSLEMARNAFNLLNCAVLSLSGEAPFGELEDVEPESERDRKMYREDELMTLGCRSIHADGFPLACMIAAKASHRRELQYALEKFRLSTLLFSHYMVDLDPSNHGYENLGASPYVARHVQYASSIIHSYSVIEEIGLEIRASPNNPSMIDGRWNPMVRADLEQRLNRAHVDLREGIYWHTRGKPTRVQRARTRAIVKRLPFVHGPVVRDTMIDICDAILQASFLRSKVSSHKTSVLTRSLTPLDSENVRHLARQLLLSKLGFWKYGHNI